MKIKRVAQGLEGNENCSDEIKELLNKKRVYMINIMGSPGAGKTSLIIKLINALKDKYNIGVIEGDIAGQIDAEKIDSLGIPVVQLNIEGACHIEALSIKNIIQYFNLDEIDLIFIENVGNLVCPAEFDVGEDLKVAILSVPEGDDKPEKYPSMFTITDTVIIGKYDMVEHFEFDDNKVEMVTNSYNPNTEVFRISTRTGEGIEDLVKYMKRTIDFKINKH
ncbi:hydrogenase nickel incorporation protein HypB [Clostridium algidicarnis]|uniref:hydrogenase nickel incorporation protein HypB n=1 Tax=Clostridium algidicarnis TaxID=37659 RepID=UPI001625CBE1|nr:hydrogenase nickel incorporation protein HypB [Clostridium algidicarnis]MBB6630303.1 hydrogenase nickel incorporation protein HypB [Clostridium algidicarnis]MBU3192880.1 hydrogenase nickel incorporation protein HypB [Clostridium algidicarnis]MBU3206159.1 hydrogenase nickel incorporation protein HypB [Clostridium algidicarnis]MCB2285908.1 hydrogenase nickel incorporation protein HypB [Clostridium algidicarnis]